jgi:nitrite reductase (NADH) small subunit
VAQVKVATRSEIAPGTAKTVEVNGKQVALFNVGGQLYAIDNTCLHRGGPLGEGEIDGKIVTCPWHGWEYDVTTGATLDDPAKKVACFKVQFSGDDVLIET